MKTKILDIYVQCAGATAGSFNEPTWHVTVVDVAETVEEAQGAPPQPRVLNMAQCADAGIDLPGALNTVAADLATARDRYKGSLDTALTANEELRADAADKQARIDELEAAAPAEVVAQERSLTSKLTFGLLK